MVQGAQRSSSALESFLSLAQLLASSVPLLVLLPAELPEEPRLPCERYGSAEELRAAVARARPARLLLCSHDARFGALRRHARTTRVSYEVARCYDPQASRCSTPLFAASPSLRQLPGFAGAVRPFLSMRHMAGVSAAYTPGPTRVLGVGDIADAHANFKGFQSLAEKFPALQFLWRGGSRNKHWHNIQFFTQDMALSELLVCADLLVWCGEGDPCPAPVLQALYAGVRVLLLDKHEESALAPLASELDGSALLHVCRGALHAALMQLCCKNPKHAADVRRSRQYVDEFATQPPRAVLALLGVDVPAT
jgi:hypothetical protein